ncbi:MAG TPA: hypothetical protein VII12_07370 [Thermoanaerobaculia bacterium]
MMTLLSLLGTLLIAILVITVAGIVFLRRSLSRPGGSGSLGNAMQEIEGLFVESKAHVLRAERAEEAEEEEGSGDPPEK